MSINVMRIRKALEDLNKTTLNNLSDNSKKNETKVKCRKTISIYVGKRNDGIRSWLSEVRDENSLRIINEAAKHFCTSQCLEPFSFVPEINGMVKNVTAYLTTFREASMEFFSTACLPAIIEELPSPDNTTFFDTDTSIVMTYGKKYFYLTGELDGFVSPDGDNMVRSMIFTGFYYCNEEENREELLLPKLPF